MANGWGKFATQYAIGRHHGSKKRLVHYFREGGLKKQDFNKKLILEKAGKCNMAELATENLCVLDTLEFVAPHKVLWALKTVFRRQLVEWVEFLQKKEYDRKRLIWSIEERSMTGCAYEYLDPRQARNLRKWVNRLKEDLIRKVKEATA